MRESGDANFNAGRRALIAALGVGAAAASLPMPGWAISPARYDRPWIPGDDFLADLPEWMRAFGVPGLGIAVLEQGQVAWTHSQGLADIATQRPVTEASQFECASLSKPVFACLVLQLVDRGDLNLETPLVRYLRPDYLATDDPRLERITVRDVLRHTSGLPNWREQADTTPLRTVAEPGRELRYSGEAFFWLQLVAEHVRGESLDRIAQALLFTPAGMQRSTYTWNATAARDSVVGVGAPGETPPVQTFRAQWPLLQSLPQAADKPLADWRWADAVAALPAAQAQSPAGMFVWPGDLLANSAASLRGPVSDYARFLAFVTADAEHGGALRASTRAAMLAPQFPVRAGWLDKGLGWNLESIAPGERWCWHGGANAGRYKTFVACDPKRRRGIVVMTNSGGGTGVYQRIVRNATGRDLLAFDV